MKIDNICKFIPSPTPDRFETHCFVYEANHDTMQRKVALKNHRVMLVTNGKGSLNYDGSNVEFSAGQLLFAFKDELFSVTPKGDCAYIYIDFSGTRSEVLFNRYGINSITRCQSGYEGLVPMWKNSIQQATDENIDLASEGILLYTFSRLSATSAEQNELINKIIQLTEENFSNPDLSVLYISEKLTYNPKYISHFFKEKTGMGYSEYLRTFRIKYAISLLEHGIDSIKNIAYLSGYTDPLYFSTVFKKVVGTSPTEYKKRLSNK